MLDLPRAEGGNNDEPNYQNRAEHESNPRRALELDDEQRSQKPDRDRDHGVAQCWRRDLQPFYRREHADGRRDNAVTKQQSRPQHERP